MLRIARRFLSSQTKTQIESLLKEKPVVVFMKGTKQAPQCGFSRAVVQILELQGVKDYKDVNILEDESLRQGIKEFTSWPTIPQVFINGEFVGGCDIMINMHQSGELESTLVENKVVNPE
jgi:monothiol glutaredoxin